MRTTLANKTICSTDYSADVERHEQNAYIIWHLYVLSESRPSGNVEAKQRAKKKSNKFCCHNIYRFAIHSISCTNCSLCARRQTELTNRSEQTRIHVFPRLMHISNGNNFWLIAHNGRSNFNILNNFNVLMTRRDDMIQFWFDLWSSQTPTKITKRFISSA